MYVKRTNQGCALTGIVVQSQQLETCIVTGAQVALYLIFIGQNLQSTACLKDMLCLSSHTIVAQHIAEDLKVLGFVCSRILVYLLEIRESTPLSLFMGNDRLVIRCCTFVVARTQ